MTIRCVVYRCAKQDEMYLYVRAGLSPDTLPEPLRARMGKLTETLQLDLTPDRKLARADTAKVLQKLETDGWYLQMPPDGHIKAHLHFGDGL